MIVQIKEYSFKTGKGIAVDPNGTDIEFTYKQLQDEMAIPIGRKAEIVGKTFLPATKIKTVVFYIFQLIALARSKFNGNS